MRSNRRGWALATLLIALIATLTPGLANATPSARDVYIRDNASDIGVEPNSGTIYTSPDIRVCNGDPWCPGINPLPGTHNRVYVDLRRKRGASGSVNGRVDVYWTSQGASATWASDWALIGSRYVSVPPSGTTVEIDWPVFPNGPVCLLARFVSDADPMTTPTPLGTGTQDDAKENNNIAWRNLGGIRLAWPDIVIDRWPLVIRWPEPDPWWTDLVIEQPDRPFVGPGRFTIDLGRELAARWRDSGLRGEGVKLIDDTRAEVFSQGTARLQGLLVKPGEQLRTELTFEAGPDLKGPYVLRVYQTDRQGIDAGGTEYRIN
jgi:hypothetical protein